MNLPRQNGVSQILNLDIKILIIKFIFTYLTFGQTNIPILIYEIYLNFILAKKQE